jgi:hypothetical protein
VPLAMSVEAIPDSSVEGLRVADTASATISSTPSKIVISLLDSSASNRGKGVDGADEAGPLRRPKVLVLERIVLFLDDEVSSGIVRVGRDPSSGEAHAFRGWMKTASVGVSTPGGP